VLYEKVFPEGAIMKPLRGILPLLGGFMILGTFCFHVRKPENYKYSFLCSCYITSLSASRELIEETCGNGKPRALP